METRPIVFTEDETDYLIALVMDKDESDTLADSIFKKLDASWIE